MAKNFYEILGVPRTATPEEIRKAYRRASKTHHPDAGGDREAAIANEAGSVARGFGIAVVPQFLAGRAVDSEDASACADQVQYAVDDDRRSLEILRIVAGLEHPGRN